MSSNGKLRFHPVRRKEQKSSCLVSSFFVGSAKKDPPFRRISSRTCGWKVESRIDRNGPMCFHLPANDGIETSCLNPSAFRARFVPCDGSFQSRHRDILSIRTDSMRTSIGCEIHIPNFFDGCIPFTLHVSRGRVAHGGRSGLPQEGYPEANAHISPTPFHRSRLRRSQLARSFCNFYVLIEEVLWKDKCGQDPVRACFPEETWIDSLD